jgi:transposase-like protein
VICSVAAKIGASGETVRKWVRQAEVDAGARPGSTERRIGRAEAAAPGKPRAASCE